MLNTKQDIIMKKNMIHAIDIANTKNLNKDRHTDTTDT